MWLGLGFPPETALQKTTVIRSSWDLLRLTWKYNGSQQYRSADAGSKGLRGRPHEYGDWCNSREIFIHTLSYGNTGPR